MAKSTELESDSIEIPTETIDILNHNLIPKTKIRNRPNIKVYVWVDIIEKS